MLAAAAPAFLVTAFVAGAIWLFWPHHWAASIGTVLVYVGTAGGPGVAIPAGLAFGLPLAFVTLLLWLVDFALALFFALAMPVESVGRVFPWLGRRLQRFHEKIQGKESARWGVLGAVAFWVGTPIHSGGAIIGTLTARACGIGPATTVATVGAAAAVRMLAWAAIWAGAWQAITSLL